MHIMSTSNEHNRPYTPACVQVTASCTTELSFEAPLYTRPIEIDIDPEPVNRYTFLDIS